MSAFVQQKEKLSSIVARQLEESILDNRFTEEQPLPSESRLCESFGVSRTVVREAIQQLKSQGIIHSIPGSGNYISKNNTKDIKRNFTLLAKLNEGNAIYKEIIELRDIMEISCIQKACERDNSELIKQLKKHYNTMLKNRQNAPVFAKADYDFHFEIIKTSNNSLFQAIFESLQDNLVKVNEKINKQPEALDQILIDHSNIIEAISSQQKNQAIKILEQHIQKTKLGV